MTKQVTCWLVAWVVVSGCMTSSGSGTVVRTVLAFKPLASPPAGWVRVTTPDYELLTDEGAEAAQRASLLLSQSLVGLRAMFGKAPIKVDRKITVIALNDSLEFERRFGQRAGGLAFTRADGVTLCLYGPPDRWFDRADTNEFTQSVVQHELAHAVLSRYFPTQPRWFAEGLAQYLETYRWLDDKSVRLGEPNLEALSSYRAIRSLSIKDMLAWDSLNERDLQNLGLYGLSWAFVYYARNTQPRMLGEYMAILASLGPQAAWRQTFDNLGPTLDQDIYKYMKVGQYTNLTIPVPPTPPVEVAVEALSDTERQTVLAHLDSLGNSMKNAK